MKKSARSFIAFDRRALLLLGTALGLTVVAVVAWESNAEGNPGKNVSISENERPAITEPCILEEVIVIASRIPRAVQGAASAWDTFDKIFVEGGFDNSTFQVSDGNYRFDGVFVTLAPIPTAVTAASAVYDPLNNKIYLFGGADSTFNPTTLNQIYDIASDSWSEGRRMPTARKNLASGYWDGKMYVTSGDDGSQIQTTTWSFDPATNEWTVNLAPIPNGTIGSGYGILGGQLFVAGGGDASTVTRHTWAYDPITNTWTQKADMPVGHKFVASSVLGALHNDLLLAGGGNSANPFAAGRTTEIYHRDTNSWSNGPDMNVGRYAAVAAATGNSLDIFSGFDGTTTVDSVETARVHCPAQTTAVTDFDGDRKTDLSIFRPGPAEWYYQKSSTGITSGFQFGTSTDYVEPVDFTGDGKTDIAVWRPSTGQWYILRSEDSTYYAFPFGSTGDIPAPADFDGDGLADAAVYRPSLSTWFVLRSTGGVSSVQFGIPTDLPEPSDYDGDGSADIAIFRPGPGEWWVLKSSNQQVLAAQFGTSTDKTTPGDFTGDGKSDMAFFRPANGTWYVLRSENFTFYAFPFGANGDKPVPGDYDGDGKIDAAVFRPTDTNWYILKSTGGVLIQRYGLSGDTPLPNAFVR